MDRQLEYEKGPPVADEQESETTSTDTSNGDDPDRNDSEPGGSIVRSSRLGLGFGVGSFIAVYAVCYQLVGAMFSGGLFAAVDQEPSRWVITGLTVLGSQGATIMNGEEPLRMGLSVYGSLTSHVTALVPIVVLSIAGYLLVRTLREAKLEGTVRNGVIAGTLCVSSYVVLSVVLAEVATWVPAEEDLGTGGPGGGTEEAEAIAVVVDSSMVLTTVGTVLTFTLIGGAAAVFVSHYSKRVEPVRSRAAESAQSESDEVSS